MENYENNELNFEEQVLPKTEEPVPQPPVTEQPQEQPWQMPPVSQPYSGAGVGRKESPFADSPYEMHHRQQPRPQNTYAPPVPPENPPVKPKKARKTHGGKVWKKVLAAVAALAVVAGSCGITAAIINDRWEKRMDAMEELSLIHI